jgi:O-antigen/teichoic acid export membrane protein
MLRRHTPVFVRQARAVLQSRPWLISSLLFGLIAGFQVINTQASTLILGIFKATDQIGVFRVTLQVATLALFSLQAVNMVVAPRFANLYGRANMARLRGLVTVSSRAILAFNLILTLLLVLTGKPF